MKPDWLSIWTNVAESALSVALLVLFYIGVWLPLICGALYAIYFLLTLPMRRSERARLFLDVVELGLKAGHAPEATVQSAAASRDVSLGVRFHLLAAYVRSGLSLGAALERVPALLPPQVRAMWRTGERVGDVTKVLPACRQLLRDGVSQTRSALNYLVVLLLCVTPLTVVVAGVITVMILPRLKEVFSAMTENGLPRFSEAVFGVWQSGLGILAQAGLLAALWLAALVYVLGPRTREWLARLWPGLVDGLIFRLPWRRKRLQRDFSAILAVLLDSGVPEAEAVTLAAETTNNAVFVRRAARVCEQLTAGVALPEALRAMDDSDELRWRLDNARHGRSGFRAALAGWHEALDAKAFQLEQAAAQTTTTALVLFNGAIIGALSVATFLLFIRVIEEGVLW